MTKELQEAIARNRNLSRLLRYWQKHCARMAEILKCEAITDKVEEAARRVCDSIEQVAAQREGIVRSIGDIATNLPHAGFTGWGDGHKEEFCGKCQLRKLEVALKGTPAPRRNPIGNDSADGLIAGAEDAAELEKQHLSTPPAQGEKKNV